MLFYAPGFRKYRTSEYEQQREREFVSISVTGSACALRCAHCNTHSLKGMIDLPAAGVSLYQVCADLAAGGTRGVLISGGSDRRGQVPLTQYIQDLVRVRRELKLSIRVHPGLPDDLTCDALAKVDLDGVMLDIIGDQKTIEEVYHLEATPADYRAVLRRLNDRNLPAIPHILLGHYFGAMRGEWHALEMIAQYPPRTLVLVILSPLNDTLMVDVQPPSLDEIGNFFETARKALPSTPIVVGCARPMGGVKAEIDKLAIRAGLNGIAYPADGIVAYASSFDFTPNFVSACCGIEW